MKIYNLLKTTGLSMALTVSSLILTSCIGHQHIDEHDHHHEPHHEAAAGDPQVPTFHIDWEAKNNPWSHLVFKNDPKEFQFAIVTDRTGSHRAGVFPDAVNKLNLLQPEFVMSVGDLIEGYSENTVQVESEWNEFEGFVDKLDMPFFYTAGNHDYTTPVMADIWKERFGESYYNFTYNDVLFIVMNSNDGGSIHHMSQRQVDWLEGVLKENPDPRWTLVFVHAPLWNHSDDDLWPQVDVLLENRKYTVFAGHHHRYVKNERFNRNYYTLATTGGGSPLRGPSFGEFDHVMWVTMTDEGPILANLLLDGIWPEDVRTGDVQQLQNELVENSFRLSPILFRGTGFSEGVSTLRLTNDSDLPYTVDLELLQKGNFVIEGRPKGPVVIEPNEVRNFAFTVREVGEDSAGGVIAEMRWDLSLVLQGETRHFTGVEPMVVMPELPLIAGREIVIDGELSDWDGLRFSVESPTLDEHRLPNWSGIEDGSFRYDAAVDVHGNLVIAVDVLDDEYVVPPTVPEVRGDSLTLTVDSRPDNQRLKNFSGKAPKDFFKHRFVPSELRKDGFLEGVHMPENVGYTILPRVGGYCLEISIPNEALNEWSIEEWNQVRIQVELTDRDDDGSDRLRFNSLGKSPLPGAGSFYRK